MARLEPLLVQGEVESTRIDIAARVSGRPAKVPVVRGEDVAAGATLLVIDNPELVAELHQAEAEKLVADAELERINVGTRSEIVAQRKAEIDRASADLTFAQQTYSRTSQLAADRFAPLSKLDQDKNALTLAEKRLDQANSSTRLISLSSIAHCRGSSRAPPTQIWPMPPALWTRPPAAPSGIARRPFWSSWRRHCPNFFSSGFLAAGDDPAIAGPYPAGASE